MADTETTSLTQFACRSCHAENGEDAKFCAHCGAALWEPCPGCKELARIGQKFCGQCGFNLQADFSDRIDKTEEAMQRAEQALQDLAFADAIAIASRLINREDPRLADLTRRADAIVEQAKSQRDQWETRLETMQVQATGLRQSRDFAAIVELLSEVPEALMPSELKQLLGTARAHIEERAELQRRLKQALQEKNNVLAGGLIDQLVQLVPDNDEYRKLALRIGEALAKSALRRFEAGAYAAALERLEAMPAVAREQLELYQQLSSRIQNVTWLTEQVARSPFATPALARLVQRLVKQAPHDERAPKLLQQAVARVKKGSQDGLQLFAGWANAVRGWKDAEVCILPAPRQFEHGNTPLIQKHPTRFAVAIGLALQGLKPQLAELALGKGGQQGGLRKLLKRRGPAEAAWGIDIGSSMLRAVKLRQQGDRFVIEQAEAVVLDEPLCRASQEMKAAVILREKLEELVGRMGEIGEMPVWTNFPSRESLGRFLTLPPLGDKQVAGLLAKEVETQFPLALDQLRYASAITGKPADGSPRAVLLAAKRQTVEQREKLFEEVGVTLAGVQADALALHQYATVELDALLGEVGQASATPEAICVLDGGATGVTMYVGTRDAFWFRFIDGGGEDLTSKLASACQLNHVQAEQQKRNPAEIESLAEGMESIEQRIAQNAIRLQQYFDQAADYLGDFRLNRIACTGGLPLTHGWIRHTFHASSK